jgi:hypothetical protein
MELFWDLESRSAANLKLVGQWVYAAHPTTEILCLNYAVGDGEVETWLSGQPVPEPFLAAARNPNDWDLIAHAYEFERPMLEHVLIPKHGFLDIPLASQHCSMALALSNGYPAELATLAMALELPYEKDREGQRLMRQMSRPRKPRKGEDRSVLHWVFDEAKLRRLIQYCAQDVRVTRAVWRHPKLRPLIESERRIQILDAAINRRGAHVDHQLATSARGMAKRERDIINATLREFTSGAITSIDQVARLKSFVNARGHDMNSLGKRSVAAVLAAEPDNATKVVLGLRRDGARASVRKYEKILAYAGADDRVRGVVQFHGGGPGRWAGRGPQLQNLKKNENNLPLEAIDAVRAGDRAQVRKYDNVLSVLADIGRAVVCAGPGNELLMADFGQIESRVLAWLSGEAWKLQTYIDFDRTGDKSREPYRIIAAQMLHRQDPVSITKSERNKGKCGELACGFGGSVGAWRRIAPEDKRPDAEILADILAWRAAHPKTTAFWKALARAIRIAISTGTPATAGKIVAEYEDDNLRLRLPSGRRITSPQAKFVPSKFEGYPPDILFKDNARGKWADYRGWFGVFVENVVQGTAADLLRGALERFEARGIATCLHVHDESVAEVPAGSISEADFLAIMLEPLPWADGLPLAGTVRHRHIPLAALPRELDATLRYHARCPLGADVFPCLVACMTDVASDQFAGIQRIALGPDGDRLERRMLGRWPTPRAVKIWPADKRLVIGEGLETTLAGATQCTYHGPLRPAWSLLSSGAVTRFPIVPGVDELVILVDHDSNNEGQNAAAACAARWSHAGRTVVKLLPRRRNTDFNDLIKGARP